MFFLNVSVFVKDFGKFVSIVECTRLCLANGHVYIYLIL